MYYVFKNDMTAEKCKVNKIVFLPLTLFKTCSIALR